jgi:hypothetical protein
VGTGFAESGNQVPVTCAFWIAEKRDFWCGLVRKRKWSVIEEGWKCDSVEFRDVNIDWGKITRNYLLIF